MLEENDESVTKLGSNFSPTFVHHVLQDIHFNELCLMNNIYIPKNMINIFLTT